MRPYTLPCTAQPPVTNRESPHAHRTTPYQSSHPQILSHNACNVSLFIHSLSVTPGLSPLWFLPCPLHYFDPLNIRREDFYPHLRSYQTNLIPEKDRCIHAAPPDGKAEPRERVVVMKCRKKDVADPWNIPVITIKETATRGFRVENVQISFVNGLHGERAF